MKEEDKKRGVLTARLTVTRIVDHDFLRKVGVADEVNKLVDNMGLREFMKMKEPTYVSNTIEFLCTFK